MRLKFNVELGFETSWLGVWHRPVKSHVVAQTKFGIIWGIFQRERGEMIDWLRWDERNQACDPFRDEALGDLRRRWQAGREE
jgi:hypothetical protein